MADCAAVADGGIIIAEVAAADHDFGGRNVNFYRAAFGGTVVLKSGADNVQSAGAVYGAAMLGSSL